MAKKQINENEKVPVFEEWLKVLRKDDQSVIPSFLDWYSWRRSYNEENNLSEPTMKQWYSAFVQLRDQTKPCHPDWFGFGTPVEYNKLCDNSLESPSQEYERLYKELKTIETKKEVK